MQLSTLLDFKNVGKDTIFSGDTEMNSFSSNLREFDFASFFFHQLTGDSNQLNNCIGYLMCSFTQAGSQSFDFFPNDFWNWQMYPPQKWVDKWINLDFSSLIVIISTKMRWKIRMSPPSIHHQNQLWWTPLWPVIWHQDRKTFWFIIFKINRSRHCHCNDFFVVFVFCWWWTRKEFPTYLFCWFDNMNCLVSKDFFISVVYLSLSRTGILKLAYFFHTYWILMYTFIFYTLAAQGLFKYRIQDWLGLG